MQMESKILQGLRVEQPSFSSILGISFFIEDCCVQCIISINENVSSHFFLLLHLKCKGVDKGVEEGAILVYNAFLNIQKSNQDY